jgi:small subunit ribosomal protein S8e
MVIVHKGNLKRKASGGRYKPARSKKKREVGNRPTLTSVGEQKVKRIRTKGGGEKLRLLTAGIANVYDPKAKKYFKVEIKTVKENPSDMHYVRRNILNKGTIIETEKGNARITSRPGQDGIVNAVLV